MGRRIVPMITEEQIKKRIKELGKMITDDYKNEELVIVCILKGSMPFTCSLMWEIDNEKMSVDYMCVSSYGKETESTGNIRIIKDLDESIEGKNVLIVEDIIDTGRTMAKLLELLSTRNPKSVKVCTLLDKPSRREVKVKIDYVGFEIENRFVAGFGLDDDQYMRQLKYVGEVIFD